MYIFTLFNDEQFAKTKNIEILICSVRYKQAAKDVQEATGN